MIDLFAPMKRLQITPEQKTQPTATTFFSWVPPVVQVKMPKCAAWTQANRYAECKGHRSANRRTRPIASEFLLIGKSLGNQGRSDLRAKLINVKLRRHLPFLLRPAERNHKNWGFFIQPWFVILVTVLISSKTLGAIQIFGRRGKALSKARGLNRLVRRLEAIK